MSNSMPKNILRINSSGRVEGSYSRSLLDQLVDRLLTKNGDAKVVDRDVSKGIEYIDQIWIGANNTPAEDRTDSQRQRLSISDYLIDELIVADTLVIGVPIYNFGIPAALKAWVDQVTRANRTFKYKDTGPIGLLTGKKAYLVITSGGTECGSDIDFATGYMCHVLGFIGITDTEIIPADQLMVAEEAKLANALKLIEAA